MPTVGIAAAHPGNIVPLSKTNAVATIAMMPIQPAAINASLGNRASRAASSAINAPSASSQARVAGEKYAQVPFDLRVRSFQQQPGDEETGDHEEHVDANKPTTHTDKVGVVEQHEADGNRPQTFDI